MLITLCWNAKTFVISKIALKINTKIVKLLNKITILVEYLDYAIIFLFKFVAKILK